MTDSGARRHRVFFITEDDPLYVVQFFEVFFAEYPPDEFDLIGITISEAFNESRLATARRILRFYGPRDFARLLGRFAAARARRRSIGRLAELHDVPVVPARSVNDEDYVARLAELQPDIVVSVAAPEIFRPPLLETPRIGCVNIHSGRLPRYRGMMPVFWQMLNREPHATITIHEMVPRLDAGPVLATAPVPIREHDTLDRIMSGAKHDGARLMIEVLRALARGRATPSPVDMDGAEYFSFPQPTDVRRFRALGHRML